jgi:hypothetical protein
MSYDYEIFRRMRRTFDNFFNDPCYRKPAIDGMYKSVCKKVFYDRLFALDVESRWRSILIKF